jgi:3-hydroxyacyl-CoA dehydrogenase
MIQKNWEATAARGGIAADEPAKRMALVDGKVGLEHVKDADLVIEAVFETMAIKKEVFSAIDAHAKSGAVLATNTSYLDINEIAAVTKRPQDVLGMHFFSPANIMKLCEVVRADKTAPDALLTATTLAKRIRKTPVVVGVCHGFVGNRMLAVRGLQGEACCSRAARCPSRSMPCSRASACPWGRSPWAISPASISAGGRDRIAASAGISPTPSAKRAAFGQKTSKGYYKYEPGSRAPSPIRRWKKSLMRRADASV